MRIDCKNCGEVVATLRPRFFANPAKVLSQNDPKYLFHVKAICPECGEYIKFVSQDDSVIAELNGQTPLL